MTKVLFAFYLFLLSCGQPGPGLAENQTVESQDKQAQFRIETVAAGLEVPWGIAFLPNKNLIFTERRGRVRTIENGKLRSEPVYTVPDVEPSSESGLMDISVHPNFAVNNFVYLAYAYNDDGKQVKVVRYGFDGRAFADPKVIVDRIPGAPNHAGTRARFGPDGKLYVTTGDATDWNLAQKSDSLAGKTLRLNDDGSIPADNPFVNRAGYRHEIYSIGHRNAQGLAWQPGSNLMFQTEHGPSGFEGRGGGADEVNIVERGKNYGWPTIYGEKRAPGLEPPLLEYSPACAPASGMFYNGGALPAFKGNFFFGCLRAQKIIRVILDGRKVVRQEDILPRTYGRIREVAEGPDGFIYFSTSNRDGRGSSAKEDDRILRLVPVK